MITVLDIETTTKGPDRSPSPFWPENYLVSVGFESEKYTNYLCFNHNNKKPDEGAKYILSRQLRMTTLLVGHNIKFDLSWLLECGFEYDGKIYDTMIYEYIKLGGTYGGLDLSTCCARYGINVKDTIIEGYFNEGIGFEAIDWENVETYGRNDVHITHKLFNAQQGELNAKSN